MTNPGAHRYWRLNQMQSTVAWDVRLAYVQCKNAGGTVLTPVGSDASSATSTTYAPDKAIDGSTTGEWRSHTDYRPYFIIDLGEALEVRTLEICAAASYTTAPITFKWEYSDDAVNWHTMEVITLSTWTSANQVQSVAFGASTAVGGLPAPPSARYWRFNKLKLLYNGGSFFAISGIKFFDGVTEHVPTSCAASTATQPAANLIDNNVATWWESSTMLDQWVTFDFGAAVSFDTIRQIAINSSNYRQSIMHMDLEYSSDNTTWTVYAPVRFMQPPSAGWSQDYTFVPGNDEAVYTFVAGGPGAHRYWRLANIRSISEGATSIATIEVKPTAGGAAHTILDARASGSFDSSLLPKKAIDGNPATLWGSTNGYGHFYAIDLGEPLEIQHLMIKARNDGGVFYRQLPFVFDWEYSDDNDTWVRFETVYLTMPNAGAVELTHEFEASAAEGGIAVPGAHRYWRLYNIESDTNMVEVGELTLTEAGTPVTISTVTASGQFDGTYTPAKTIDGSAATWWSSNVGSLWWLRFDLGSAKSFDKLQLTNRNSTAVLTRSLRKATLQYSDDDSNWTTHSVVTFFPSTLASEAKDFTFNASSGTPGTGIDGFTGEAPPPGGMDDAILEATPFIIINDYNVGTTSSGYYILMKRRKNFNYLVGG